MKKKDISQKILQLHAMGMTVDAISHYVGVDIKTVNWVLKQAGKDRVSDDD